MNVAANATSSGDSQTERATEIAERQITRDVDLYKFYLELVLKGAVFSLGMTGAMLSYFLANYQNNPMIRWSMLLPILINGGFAVLCWSSIAPAKRLAQVHQECCAAASIKPYDMATLPMMVRLFSGVFIIVTATLVALWRAI